MSANKILIKLWYLHTDKILPNHYKLQMKRTDKLQSYKMPTLSLFQKVFSWLSPTQFGELLLLCIPLLLYFPHHSIDHILYYYLFNFPSFF